MNPPNPEVQVNITIQDQMASRVLHKYEQHVGVMSVGVSFVISDLSENVSIHDLRNAIKLTLCEHSVFRTIIQRDADKPGEANLVQLSEQLLKFEDDCFVSCTEHAEELPSKARISSRLVDECRCPGFSAMGLFKLKAAKYQDGIVFYLIVNHGVTDGTSVFAIVDSFCENLSIALTRRSEIDNILLTRTVQPLRDLFQELLDDPKVTEAEDSRFTDDYSKIMKFPTLTDDNADAANNGCIRAVFLEFDESTSAAVLANCRKHGVSVQALLCSAAALAMIKLKHIAGELDEDKWNTPIVHCVPVNMRRFLQDADRISSSVSSCLTWCEAPFGSWEALADRPFWKDLVAQDMNAAIRACVESNFPHQFIPRLEQGKAIPPTSLMSSSVGNITSVKPQYEAFKLRDVTMQAGFFCASDEAFLNPAIPPGMVGSGAPGHVMLHAYSVFGRLKITGSYYAYSTAFIAQYYDEVYRILSVAGSAAGDNEELRVRDIFAL